MKQENALQRYSGTHNRRREEPIVKAAAILAWWPIVAGLLVLYAPTYLHLARGPWTKEENVHGVIVFVIVAWMLAKALTNGRTEIDKTQPGFGGFLFVAGLSVYVIGRSQGILSFEVISQIPVLLGVALIVIGGGQARKILFPILFLVFVVPFPSYAVEWLTSPLKHQVSSVVAGALYELGYPIAREGVVLTIGPYQLLIADACSGIKSTIALLFMGALFVYLRGRKAIAHNAVLLISIVPIAYLINIVRVTALTLSTYHYGEGISDAYVHGVLGIIEFAIALALMFVIDWILAKAVFKRTIR